MLIIGWANLFFACSVDPLENYATEADYPTAEPGESRLRRLNGKQFQNALADIFGNRLIIPDIAEPDVVINGMPNIGASTSTFGARGIEGIETISYFIAEQIMGDEDMRSRIATCTPITLADAECANEIIRNAGLKIWRRPLSETESNQMVTVALNAATVLNDFYSGMEFGLAALIQSPYFLYRVELGEDNQNTTLKTYGPYEMASKLSHFLWNSGPDDTLLHEAANGGLQDKSSVFNQAERMMEDPKYSRGIRQFFTEMLRLYELEELTKDPTLFEHYTADLGHAATEETLRFYERIVSEGIDYKKSMTSKETEINQQLAAIYEIPAPVFSGDFGQAVWPEDSPRGGWLGQVSFLAQNAHAVSTSATLRGKAVRSILLCQAVPPAPVDVDTSIPEPSGTTLTLRDRVAEHLENESCAGCHQLMDPIGLGFENFDGIGRWRETDNGAEIDASGELEGQWFENALEVGGIISNSPLFTRCMVTALGRYANGRLESTAERELISVLDDRFNYHERQVNELIKEMILSPLFLVAGTAQ